MGRFTGDIAGMPGYFRKNGEDEFPWSHSGKGVWFALFVVEAGAIERYGFTASKANKASLVRILKALDPTDDAVLLGVWTGQYNTDLFVLDRRIAIDRLNASGI